MKRIGFSVLALWSLVLAGCVDVTHSQLRPDMWLVQTEDHGAGERAVGKAILKRAAELTLKNGYTHFTLIQGPTEEKLTIGGTTPVNAGTFFMPLPNGPPPIATYTGGMPLYIATKKKIAVVNLLRASDEESKSAYDAKDVLSRLQKKK